MNGYIFNDAVETLIDYDGFVVISDLGITLNGTEVDCLKLVKNWDGGYSIKFFAGDPTDEDGEWEELLPTDSEAERILQEFNELF